MQAELVALGLGKSSTFIEQRIVDEVIAGDIDRKHAIGFDRRCREHRPSGISCRLDWVHRAPPLRSAILTPAAKLVGNSKLG